MLPQVLEERLVALTDDLIVAEGLDAAYLAAILVRAQQELACGSIGALCRTVWQIEPQAIECRACGRR